MVVLGTTMQKVQGDERFFIYDCNNGVINKEFNEKLCDFLKDAVKNYDPKDKRIVKNIQAIKDFLKSLPEGKVSTQSIDRIMNMVLEIET